MDNEETDEQETNQNDETNTDGNKGGKTYSQEDVNRMMAAKAKEAKSKEAQEWQAKLDEATKSAKSDRDKWLAEGEKRAKMSADEKAKAEFADKQKAIDEREKAFQEKMDAFDRDRALSNTKEALIDANLPKDFANFLTDIDDDKRTENIKNFSDAFKKAVDEAVDQRIAGKKTPDTGSNSNPSSVDMPKTRNDFFNLPIEQQQQLMQDHGEYIRKNFFI